MSFNDSSKVNTYNDSNTTPSTHHHPTFLRLENIHFFPTQSIMQVNCNAQWKKKSLHFLTQHSAEITGRLGYSSPQCSFHLILLWSMICCTSPKCFWIKGMTMPVQHTIVNDSHRKHNPGMVKLLLHQDTIDPNTQSSLLQQTPLSYARQWG